MRRIPTDLDLHEAEECDICEVFGVCLNHKWIHDWIADEKKRDIEELRRLGPQPEIKYVVHPGFVTSTYDRQQHYIGFLKLCQLYGVNPRNCIDASDPHSIRGMRLENFELHLYPDAYGSYTLERCEL